MRRLVLSLVVLCASLSACSGAGGYAFNNQSGGKIDRVVFSAGNAAPGIFKLAPTGTNVLQITAIGTKGSQNSIVPDATFVWTASVAPAGTFYNNAINGQASACPTPAAGTIIGQDAVTSPLVLAFPAANGALTPATNGSPNPLGNFDAYDPARQSSAAYVIPTTKIAPPFCLIVKALHSGDGVFGTQVVFVGFN